MEGTKLNHLDEGTHSADYYIGTMLTARVPVDGFLTPGNQVRKTFQKGTIVGKVKAYRMYEGFLWWQLEDSGLFVRHQPEIFDVQFTNGEVKTMGKDSVSMELESPLNALLGKNLWWLLILLLIIILFVAKQRK